MEPSPYYNLHKPRLSASHYYSTHSPYHQTPLETRSSIERRQLCDSLDDVIKQLMDNKKTIYKGGVKETAQRVSQGVRFTREIVTAESKNRPIYRGADRHDHYQKEHSKPARVSRVSPEDNDLQKRILEKDREQRRKSKSSRDIDPKCFCIADRVRLIDPLPHWKREREAALKNEKNIDRRYDFNSVADAWNRFYGIPNSEEENGTVVREMRMESLQNAESDRHRGSPDVRIHMDGLNVRRSTSDITMNRYGPRERETSRIADVDKPFYGAAEVEACVSHAIRFILRTQRAMKNVQFCAGTLFPTAETYVNDLSDMQKHLKQFNTQFRITQKKTAEILNEGGGDESNGVQFEKPRHGVKQRFPLPHKAYNNEVPYVGRPYSYSNGNY